MQNSQRAQQQLARTAREATDLPCRIEPDLFFAEHPQDVERAKGLCATCPLQQMCLQTAIAAREPWGVWGGELIEHGRILARKRARGRPRKTQTAA